MLLWQICIYIFKQSYFASILDRHFLDVEGAKEDKLLMFLHLLTS